MLNGPFSISSLQTYNQLTGNKPYTIVEYADRAIVHLNKAEAIYNENFVPIIADLLRRKCEIEINCGRKNPGAEFIAKELCSEDIKRRIYTQDHEKAEGNDSYDFTVSIKPSVGFFDSPELENIIVVIKRKSKDIENQPTAPDNTIDKSNCLYMSNIATLNINNFNEVPGNLVSDTSYQSTTLNSEEILLDGYGPWNDEFDKALYLIEQGQTVVLKKDDPIGIEENIISLEIKRGQNKEEILIDLTNLGLIECSDILPKLLTYLLNQDGKSVIVNCGFIESDDLAGEVEEYLIPDLPCNTTYEITEREIPQGYNMHPVVIFK